MATDFRWNQREEDRLLKSLRGPLAGYLRQAGDAVRDEAKRLCPVSEDGSGENKRGHLRRSIKRRVERDEQGLVCTVGTDVDYALHVELGTRPHVIRSHGDYPLRNRRTKQVFGREVQHPGTTAQPYLRPALRVLRDLP